MSALHPAPGGIIRRFRPEDARAVTTLIANTLLVSNTGDYSLEEISTLAAGYSSRTLQALSSQTDVWVYTEGRLIQGVVCLDGSTVQALFVAPDRQGRGVGRALLRLIEGHARRRGVTALEVPASLTAVAFYLRVGFHSLGPGRSSGGVRIERMRKEL